MAGFVNWNLPWLVHNSQRRYPLTNDSAGKDQTGSFTIPNSFIVEMTIPVSAGNDIEPGKFYIKNIGSYSTGYSIIVGYDADEGPVDVATALIARQSHTRNKVYALGGQEPFQDTVGHIVIGVLDDADTQPPGFYTFDPDQTLLEPDVIRPIIRGVSSITLVNSGQKSVPLYGDIELEAGNNIQLVPIVVAGQDPIIRINAIEGAGLTEECVCEGASPSEPIETINGIPPTPSGDFTILGDDCLELQPIPNGLRIIDKCSKPCCGCEELEAITRDLQKFGEQAKALELFMSKMESEVSTFSNVILGSRLRDKGCDTCP